jgi:hypothetical protein
MVLGTITSAFGEIEAGKADSAILRRNAALSQQAGVTRQRQAAIEADRVREEGESFKSSQEAAFAASGVTLEGSPMQALLETARNVETDALNVRYGGDVEAQQLREKATSQRFEAKVRRRQGINRAAGTLLGGLGQAGAVFAGGARRQK